MPWVLLAIASVFEVIFAVAMKQSQGFTKLVPSLVVVGGGIGGVFFLTLALRSLPLSIGYPVWVGLGIVGVVILGLVMFDEPLSIVKVLGILLVFAGIVLLHQADAHQA